MNPQESLLLQIGRFFGSIAPKGWIAIGLVALLIAGVITAVLISGKRDDRLIETAQEGGAANAVITGQNTTLRSAATVRVSFQKPPVPSWLR